MLSSSVMFVNGSFVSVGSIVKSVMSRGGRTTGSTGVEFNGWRGGVAAAPMSII